MAHNQECISPNKKITDKHIKIEAVELPMYNLSSLAKCKMTSHWSLHQQMLS